MFSRKSMNQTDKYLFDVNDYKVISNINKGSFGVINLVQNKKDGSRYAAKTYHNHTEKQYKLFISREVRILIQVQHPTIIKFRGFSYVDFNNDKNITILMDYKKNGSLADLISLEERGCCPSGYDNTKRQIILIGIARGMMLLHKLKIIHRDLKPENILLDDNYYPIITDFGLSKFVDPENSMNQSMSSVGIVSYMAPEILKEDGFNSKVDVFAFGILMYEVLTGKRAYSEYKDKGNIFQFMKKVSEGLRPTIKQGMMKKSHQIMIEKCLSENPNDRPTFTELYKKLSLLQDDLLFEFSLQAEQEVICYEEENKDDEEENLYINKTFCLILLIT